MQSLARPAQLGPLISDHPQSVVGSRGRMIQSYIALGIGTLLLLVGLIAFVLMAEAEGQGALICLGFAGFCVLGVGLLGIVDARNTRDMSLKIYEHGLHYVDKTNEKIWTWDQIEAIIEHQIVNQQTRLVRHTYQLFNQHGDTLMIYDHVRNPAAAIATIRQNTYALLLPKLSAAFVAGQPVAFGAVTLTPSGLQVKGKPIAWNEIASIRPSGNLLLIDRHGGGWFNDLEVYLHEVTNVELLLQLSTQRIAHIS